MGRTGKLLPFLCLILAFWFCAANAAEKQTDVPIIDIESPTYEFEEISQGETVRHTFKVRNKGTAPLQIKGVKPG